MKVHSRANDTGFVGWLQRRVESLRRALASLPRLLAPDRQPAAMVLIPIRAVQPHSISQPQRRTRRD